MITLKLPTKTKVTIARWLSKLIVVLRSIFGLSSITRVSRRGLRWLLDLKEGIDLAIYLGVYEPETIKALEKIVSPGDVILDIGANIGAITLPLAKFTGDTGLVIAFEPTEWAFNKLQRNLSLNPNISKRVRSEQIMLLEASTKLPSSVYSSWSLTDDEDEMLHPQHKGKLMTTDGARGISLDEYFEINPIDKVDLIKLDVDGYELVVLKGARKTLERYRPKIVMEMAPYIQEEKQQLVDILNELEMAQYRLEDLTSGKPIPMTQEGIERICPQGGGINVLVKPKYHN